MRTITPLTIEDFNKGAITVISKVEIDTDGAGNFQELPDIKTYSISTNEENRVAKFCSYSFNITCLNIDDRYGPLNSSSPYYNYLKQGRRIKLWAGIRKDEEDHPYQLILGRVDSFKPSKKAGEDICTITGRCLMRMVLDFKLYSPNTYWGTSHIYDTVANQIRYDMEVDCKGVYRVFLDSTSPYDGSHLEEIYENSDWSYDWHNNQLIFTPKRIPDFAGTDNLKVYYFQEQNVEDVVADILLAAEIFADEAAKNTWLVSEYCTATEKTIERVWFNTGTSALKAITLLSEVVQYRFYFDYAGNPIFKQKPSTDSPVNTISDYETKVENVGESVDETYTHIIVIGEERDRVEGDDEVAPDVPTSLALSTGLGLPTQASLSWIKAEWEANTESDFGHYELRIRKIGDADFTEVSTIAISFIWYGLEPGVEYGVQIRAVDIYNNRSNWSTEVTKLTATDADVPAQIAGAVATAILAGIKIFWERAMEDDIAGYKVERQESDNGTTWIGAWTERVRTNATGWMDLLLPYVKYYRYRISAYTQTGVEGATSTPTANSIAPNKAGANDVVAKCLTADQIYGNKLSVIFADMGQIVAGDITLNALGFIRTSGKTSYADATAGFWLGYDGAYKLNLGNATQYLKWDGANLIISGSITLVNTIPNAKVDGLGALALENAADWGTQVDGANKPANNADVTASNPQAYGWITGAKPPINADVTLTAIQGELSLAGGGLVLASAGAKVRGGQTAYGVGTGFWLGDVGGVSKFSIGSASNWLKWTGTALQIKGRLSVGGGTNEDILFEDSGIRMYDAVSGYKKQIYWKYGTVDFARLTYNTATVKETNLHLYAGSYGVFLGLKDSGVVGFITNSSQMVLGTGYALSSLMFWTGTRQLYLGVSVNAPTSNNYAGQIIIKEGGLQNALHIYTTAWRSIQSNLGW